MMIVTLAAPQFDMEGFVILKPTGDSRLGDTTRRISRVATLDGGAVAVDYGFSDADRTVTVQAIGVTRDEHAALLRLQKTFGMAVLCCESGCYYGAIQSLQQIANGIGITFLVTEKLA